MVGIIMTGAAIDMADIACGLSSCPTMTAWVTTMSCPMAAVRIDAKINDLMAFVIR
jgi:hypothetical protein